MAQEAQETKLCLLGGSGVGKSSIMRQFVTQTFDPHFTTTVGAAYMSKTVTVDGATFKFQIWDTAGQERFRSLAPMYYRGAAVAAVVYDITSLDSQKAVKFWVQELRDKGPHDIVLALVGNKIDQEKDRRVSRQEMQMYAESLDAIFIETSARTAENVAELFEAVGRKLLQRRAPVAGAGRQGKVLVPLSTPAPRKKGFC